MLWFENAFGNTITDSQISLQLHWDIWFKWSNYIKNNVKHNKKNYKQIY